MGQQSTLRFEDLFGAIRDKGPSVMHTGVWLQFNYGMRRGCCHSIEELYSAIDGDLDRAPNQQCSYNLLALGLLASVGSNPHLLTQLSFPAIDSMDNNSE